MARQTFSSGGAFEPVYGYSRAVRVGNHIHIAGTTARPPHLAGCDSYEQACAALAIIGDALTEVGARLEDVVRTVVYVTDIADATLVARAHREAFGHILPVSTLVQVSALLDPAMRVEIEAYAIIDG
ncbi:MAG TPA: RidA family protein [Stellaceae bacterium]|nr:RidA family protein [Stellaceae bacterium]